MLLLTPESARWRWITALLGAVMVAAYWWTSRDGFAHGGSTTGLAFGVVAVVLLAFLVSYWVRKRFQRGTPGRLESWCQAHVYLGMLVVLAVVLHSGFRFHDRVAVAALAVMGAVRNLPGLDSAPDSPSTFGGDLYRAVSNYKTMLRAQD